MSDKGRGAVTVQHGPHQVKLHIPESGHISRLIRETGSFYEPALLGAIQALARTGTYVDVGAHVGNHTVFFAECCQASCVIAVEPAQPNLVWLKKNVEGREHVTIRQTAVGVRDDAKTTTLDTVLTGVNDVAVVKIDVGAGADKVLVGAKRLLSKQRPVVAVEAATKKLYEQVQTRLSRYGYVVKGCYNPTPTYLFVPVDVVVNVITYNRPLYLERLLHDLALQPSFATVRIYEDASTVDMGRSVQFARARKWFWHRFSQNHGKRGFWQVVTKVMQDARGTRPDTMFVWLPDDVRLCDDFVVEALAAYNSVSAGSRVALNLQAEKYRDNVPCWTGFEPKRVCPRLWRTQWVDGVMLCGHAALRAVDYTIPKPPETRWANPTISSGVWQYFSQKLHSGGLGIYRCHESLVAHMRGPSVMHGALRDKQPLSTTRFKGGPAKHAKLMAAGAPRQKKTARSPGRATRPRPARRPSTEQIQASLASVPSRVEHLRKVVESLLPQVDVVRVYLNGYKEVPKFLKRKRVAVVLSQKHGDRGDAGKFFWCEKARGYQLTCDDDLIYPAGYVAHLISGIERFRRRAIVGLHGICIDQPVQKSYYADRRILSWRNTLERDTQVHLLGTGCLGYHADSLKVKRSDFEHPNMADVWLGLLCQRERVPMIAIAHQAQWLSHLGSPWTIYGRQKGKDVRQTRAVQRIKTWGFWLKKGGS